MEFAYYARLVLETVDVPRISVEYEDWLFGRGKYSKNRQRRLELGVLPAWPPADWPPSVDLHGEHDCQLSLRSGDGTAVIRWIHRDSAQGQILWHNLIRLSTVGRSTVVEHAVARSAPRDSVLAPLATCPKVLASLIQAYGARVHPKELCTGRPTNLSRGDVADFVKYVMLDRSRTAPIVVVTPTKDDGRLLVQPEGLAASMVGMASVAVIREKEVTFELADALAAEGFERALTCFDGGVRIYEGPLSPEQSPYQHRLWLRRRIEGIAPADRQSIVAGEVAARVVARQMPWSFRGVVEEFDKAQKRRVAEALLARVEGDRDKTRSPELEAQIVELKSQLDAALRMQDFFDGEHKKAEERLASAIEDNERLQRERDERSAYIEDLQRHFDELKRARNSGGLSDELLGAVRAAIQNTPTVEQALMVISALYGDRVVVLDSAWRSAKKSTEFRFPERAFELLLLLVTDYWESLAAGRGDTEARKVLGNSYAPSESEVSETNKRARSLRTFHYDGRDVEMFQHLKIGVKDSVYETWRTYFTWDAERRLLVIGHCGPHLDLR